MPLQCPSHSTQTSSPYGASIQEYQVLELLGKGGFAHVYRGQCRRSGSFVAIKMIDKALMANAGMVGRVRQEVSIHSRLKHPTILELYTFFEDAHYVYLILELAHNGELARYFRLDADGLTEENAADILGQVVDGVMYLHSHRIIHRDLSLNNLLLTKDLRVKIADFGLATQLNEPNEKHMTMCGTPNYISPEVASKSHHGLPADVWGLGCLLYTLLVGKPPFDTQHIKQTLNRVIRADYQIPPGLSNEAHDLLDRLLRKNPAERISLNEIICHPFLTKSRGSDNSQSELSKDSGFHTTLHTTHSTQYRSRSEDRIPSASCEIPYRQRINSVDKAVNLKTRPTSLNILSGIKNYEVYNLINPVPENNLNSNISSCSLHFKTEKIKNMENEHHDSGIGAFRPENEHNSYNQYITKNEAISDATSLQKRSDTKENCLGKRTIGVPPLCAIRLNKVSHRTRTAEYSIVEDGSVRVHSIKKCGRLREERITEVCIISKDGMQIIVYSVNGGKGCPLSCPLPAFTPSPQDMFSYHNLPQKYWKQYLRAASFVDIIKAKTPKITLYTNSVKCHLMENGTDFEGLFYSGTKIKTTASDGTKVIDKEGETFRVFENLREDLKECLDHFQECTKKCLAVESALHGLSEDCFPLTMGRRLDVSQTSTPISQVSLKNTPNLAFGSTMSLNSFCATGSSSSKTDFKDKKYNDVPTFETGSLKSFNPSGERNLPFKSNSSNTTPSYRIQR